MTKKGSNSAKIAREEKDLENLLSSLPLNPIPWVTIVKLLAPIVARLAIRYALKRLKRGMSEEKVNAIGDQVGDFIGDIVAKRTTPESDNGGA